MKLDPRTPNNQVFGNVCIHENDWLDVIAERPGGLELLRSKALLEHLLSRTYGISEPGYYQGLLCYSVTKVDDCIFNRVELLRDKYNCDPSTLEGDIVCKTLHFGETFPSEPYSSLTFIVKSDLKCNLPPLDFKFSNQSLLLLTTTLRLLSPMRSLMSLLAPSRNNKITKSNAI